MKVYHSVAALISAATFWLAFRAAGEAVRPATTMVEDGASAFMAVIGYGCMALLVWTVVFEVLRSWRGGRPRKTEA